jgi:hypothetical protein
MKKRIWVSVMIECDIEFEATQDNPALDDDAIRAGLKEKLQKAGIAEYSNLEAEQKTLEIKCEECGDWKEIRFIDHEKKDICIDCSFDLTEAAKDDAEIKHMNREYERSVL